MGRFHHHLNDLLHFTHLKLAGVQRLPRCEQYPLRRKRAFSRGRPGGDGDAQFHGQGLSRFDDREWVRDAVRRHQPRGVPAAAVQPAGHDEH